MVLTGAQLARRSPALIEALEADRQGLVLLAIDQRLLDSEIRWEEPQPTVEAFPHIYGPVNLDAVIAVERFDPGEDGDFEVPNAIRRLADEYAARASLTAAAGTLAHGVEGAWKALALRHAHRPEPGCRPVKVDRLDAVAEGDAASRRPVEEPVRAPGDRALRQDEGTSEAPPGESA